MSDHHKSAISKEDADLFGTIHIFLPELLKYWQKVITTADIFLGVLEKIK